MRDGYAAHGPHSSWMVGRAEANGSLLLGRQPALGPRCRPWWLKPNRASIPYNGFLPDSRMKRIAILGSTGSIGRSTLSVVESYPDRFQVATLAAGNNAELAFEQAVRWKPRVFSMAKEQDADALRVKLRGAGLSGIEVVHGAAGTVLTVYYYSVDSPAWGPAAVPCG